MPPVLSRGDGIRPRRLQLRVTRIRPRVTRREEPAEGPGEPGGIIQPGEVAGTRLDRERPPGEEPGHLGQQLRRGHGVQFARVDQHGRGQGGQRGPGRGRVERPFGVEAGPDSGGLIADCRPRVGPGRVVPPAVEEGLVAEGGLQRFVAALRGLRRGPGRLEPGLRRAPAHRGLLLLVGEGQPQRTHAGGEQDQVTDPLRVRRRVEQGHVPARGVAEQVHPLQAQPGPQRLHIPGDAVTAVGGRVGGHLAVPGAPGVRQDQFAGASQAAEVTQVAGAPAGPPGTQTSGGPDPARR